MMKDGRFMKKFMSFSSFIAFLWALPLLLHYVYSYLYDKYYLYIGWNLLWLDGSMLVLTVLALIFAYRKWARIYFVRSGRLILLTAFAVHVCFFVITGNVMLNFLIAFFAAGFAVIRTESLSLKKSDSVAEINDIAAKHVIAMTAAAVLYITSMLFNLQLLQQVMAFFNIANVYIAALILLTFGVVACSGSIYLFRVLFLNTASKYLNK